MQETAKRLVRDLRRLIQLLDHDIDVEEERTGIPDLANSNYSATARQIGAGRGNFAAAANWKCPPAPPITEGVFALPAPGWRERTRRSIIQFTDSAAIVPRRRTFSAPRQIENGNLIRRCTSFDLSKASLNALMMRGPGVTPRCSKSSAHAIHLRAPVGPDPRRGFAYEVRGILGSLPANRTNLSRKRPSSRRPKFGVARIRTRRRRLPASTASSKLKKFRLVDSF